jgi:hypothetical protein
MRKISPPVEAAAIAMGNLGLFYRDGQGMVREGRRSQFFFATRAPCRN